MAAITVSARRRGLPQHRGRNPKQQSGAPSGLAGSTVPVKIRAVALAKAGHIRHGKR